MKLFKTYSIIVLSFCCVHIAVSQNSKVNEARVNFISQKLQLTAAESKIFWPIFNEYIDKMKSIRNERNNLFKNFDYTLNPAEAELFITKQNQLNDMENQIKSEYIQKFRKIIGVVKTAHLLKAEEEFRLELLKILKADKSQ